MTREEINKYVEMGDIEKGEEITTERAIAELYRLVRVAEGESYDYENLTPKVLDMSIQALSTESKWIPVSERLSETGIEVLICDKEGTIYLSHKTSFDNYFDEWGNEIKNVRAWMPLPAPYEESEETECDTK